MTTAVRTAYETRSYTPDDEAQVLNLLRASLGESRVLQRTPHMWQWKHAKNTFGPSLVRVAVDKEGGIVGLRAFLRWRFLQGGKPIRAVRPVDTATHPSHQRRGIFARLTIEALEEARRDGVSLVYNTPNAQSMSAYLKLKLGWQIVGGVRPLVRVLNYRRFAAGLAWHRLARQNPPHYPYSTAAFFKAQPLPPVEALLKDGRGEGLLAEDAELWGSLLHTDRSMEYFAWRYAHHPTIGYRVIGVEESGSLEACGIVRTNTRFGLREVVLSELLVRRPEERLVRTLVNKLVAALDADYLIASFPEGSFQRAALQDLGFWRMPVQGMTLVANPIGRPLGELAHLSQWGIALGDLEFF